MRLVLIPYLVILVLTATVLGCDDLQKQLQPTQPEINACPPQLAGVPSPDGSGISFSSGKARANITSVLVECIPSKNTGTEKAIASMSYEIAATAQINYEVKEDYGTFEDSVVFEVTTAKGVVLKEGSNSFRLVRGFDSGKTSAVIAGLSTEEISRAARVTARWKY